MINNASFAIVLPMSNEENDFEPMEIIAGQSKEFEGKLIKIEIVKRGEEKYLASQYFELISADDLKELFILRKWKPGDKFIPLGMNSFKKVSDFLNEQKVPSVEKKEQFVLENNENIVWVIGLRIDNRYKLTPETQRVCKLWIN